MIFKKHIKRISFIITIALFFSNALPAQDRAIITEGASPNLYIIHKLEPKENYYSLGRMYNVPPKEIAPYNHLDFAKGLSVGQMIKIPLNANNFSQNNIQSDDVFIPVYHIIKPKEGLYRVSETYYKVSLDQLKKWNHLSTDAVSSGTKLIIGFLKVQKNVSPLAQGGNIAKPSADIKKEPKQNPEFKEKLDAVNNAESKKTHDSVIQVKPAIKDKSANNNNNQTIKTTLNFNGGNFKALYDNQHQGDKASVTESGLAGVFKSTSGWKDGKYYCFNNSAKPGTILKITNSSNGKSVYAKVLDLIPDINQNAGLILHISNAAAEELDVSSNKFDCSINYVK